MLLKINFCSKKMNTDMGTLESKSYVLFSLFGFLHLQVVTTSPMTFKVFVKNQFTSLRVIGVVWRT